MFYSSVFLAFILLECSVLASMCGTTKKGSWCRRTVVPKRSNLIQSADISCLASAKDYHDPIDSPCNLPECVNGKLPWDIYFNVCFCFVLVCCDYCVNSLILWFWFLGLFFLKKKYVMTSFVKHFKTITKTIAKDLWLAKNGWACFALLFAFVQNQKIVLFFPLFFF